MVSDFFPSSKAQFIALQYIMLAEYEILTTIGSFSNPFGENSVAGRMVAAAIATNRFVDVQGLGKSLVEV